jgi:hypothetical protein
VRLWQVHTGVDALHRLRDLADVQDLIRILELPVEFAEKLDASVRGEYRRLWQTTQEGKVDEARRFSQLGKLASPVMVENNV